MNEAALRQRFTELWERLGATGDATRPFTELIRRWREPHRSYHGLEHLADCLARLDEAMVTGKERDLAEAALWYHDIVYQPGSADNETRSAELARAALLEGGLTKDIADEVARLVRATDHTEVPEDALAALVCDVDLSILGRPAEEFAAYERRIREEYRHLPDFLYRSGRSAVLTRLLARDPLFLTLSFRNRYEAAAQRNLARSLQALSVPGERT